jgi:hypothetical protein
MNYLKAIFHNFYKTIHLKIQVYLNYKIFKFKYLKVLNPIEYLVFIYDFLIDLLS